MPVLVADGSSVGVSTDVLRCLPRACPYCLSQLGLSTSGRSLECLHAFCPYKLASRVKTFARDVGINGMGFNTALKFVQHYDVKSPLDLFTPELSYLGLGDGISEKVSNKLIVEINRAKESLGAVSVADAIRLANIPHVRDVAYTLCAGFDSVEDFFDAVESGGAVWVSERLSGRSGDDVSTAFASEVSVSALLVYNALMLHKDANVSLAGNFTLRDYSVVVSSLSLCISGAVGAPYTSKKDFIQSLGREFPHIEFNEKSSVSKSLDVLVTHSALDHSASVSSKVARARALNRDGFAIPIVTGQQLVDYLKSGADFDDLYAFVSSSNVLM